MRSRFLLEVEGCSGTYNAIWCASLCDKQVKPSKHHVASAQRLTQKQEREWSSSDILQGDILGLGRS